MVEADHNFQLSKNLYTLYIIQDSYNSEYRPLVIRPYCYLVWGPHFYIIVIIGKYVGETLAYW